MNDAVRAYAAPVQLRRKFRAQRRREGRVGLALVAPLLVYMAIFLAGPLVAMLTRSVYDPSVGRDLPGTVAALDGWRLGSPVPERAARAVIGEARRLYVSRRIGETAARLDFEASGAGSLLTATARTLAAPPAGSALAALERVDPRWATPEPWAAIKRAGPPLTASFFIRAVDLRQAADGRLTPVAPGEHAHLALLWKTIWLAALITAVTLVLAYPLAWFIVSLPPRWSRVAMLAVVVSLWLSLLVRAMAWIALLQGRGVVTDLVVALGLAPDAHRPQLLYNLTGVVIAMTHVLLPSMVLPIASTMRRIPKSLTRAAQSLGAHPWIAFVRVYLPATLPGVGVAVLFGFILAVGFYIIPSLLGGASGKMISSLVAVYVNETLEYGLASALGALVLAVVLVLYAVYARLSAGSDVSLGTGADVAIVTDLPSPPAHAGWLTRLGLYAVWALSGLTLLFLLAPVVVIVPLSFSASPFFTFDAAMLHPTGWSLRWYAALLSDPRWRIAFVNSFVVATFAAGFATLLGGLAALGLARASTPARRLISALFLSPVIIPVVLVGAGAYLMFARIGLVGTFAGVVLAHVALIAPAVVFNVGASLAGSGPELVRAAASLGASPLRSFFALTLPLAAPGFAAGALFAFLGSFDETVVVQFLTYSPDQFTVPRQMFSGIRDEMSPTVLAAGVVVVSVCLAAYALSALLQAVFRRR